VSPIFRIAELAERTDLLSVVAGWIYDEWWSEIDGASVGEKPQNQWWR
jgi:hypothetical protein